METRAHYVAIGSFTLLVIAAAFAFVYWFRGSDGRGNTMNYRIVFTGSVSGLSKGSLVMYNGLKVGEVTSLALMPEDPSRVVAIATVDAATPMNTDTKARLEFQGLTGVASVQLSGGGPNAQPLISNAPGKPPIIYADRSDFQDLLESAQRLAKKAEDVLTQADRLFTVNAGAINATVRNVEMFSKSLAENSDGVGKFLASTGNAADKISSLAVTLEGLSNNIDTIVRSVNPADVSKIISDLQQISSTVADGRDDIKVFMKDVSVLAKRLNDATVKLDGVLGDVGNVTKAIDPAKLGKVVDNFERFSTALSNNTQNTDQIIKNTNELTAKLNRAADKVEGLMTSLQGFLGSDDGKEAAASFADTAQSIRKLAENLDKRTAEMAANFNRVAGTGTRDLDVLTAEARRTLSEINRTLSDFNRNPQQILFGSRPSLPEYNRSR
jgi:phospholipid/cholesterol/gamma-HCH transport system substrate-binding protein